MEITLWQYATIFVLIGFSGFIDSIAGGGGLISVPAYIAIGLPTEFVLGTNKCVSSTGATLAVFRYIINGRILWRVMIAAIITAFIGSAVGASLSRFLSREIMFVLLLIAIPCIFCLQYFEEKRTPPAEKGGRLPVGAGFRAAVIGFFLGAYDGIFGPGTGTFILIAFLVFLNFSPQQASANARLINYASNIAAFLFFVLNGRIFWPIAFVAIAGSLCGNWIGSGMVLSRADTIVVPVFRAVLTLLMVKCGWDLSG